ncbi:MAG: MATE family efflux transporter [Kiritimatiellae bacterium]|jgi:MATE family multidrug resistance protein|nr:MATE family efflux transporter [Kiritimatiellia bacterium]
MKKIKEIQPGSMRETANMALPMIVSSACDTLMIFIDRLFLAKVSTHNMNASMLGGLTVFMLSTFFLGLIGYSTALVAQYFGSEQKSKCSVATFQALIIAVIAAPIIRMLRPLVFAIFENSNLVTEQLVLQKQYASILNTFVIFVLIRSVFACFFSGTGRTKIVMISALTAMVVNVGMNYLLIFGKYGFPAMGIRGAAYGTVIGTAVSVIVMLSVYLSKKNIKEYVVNKSFHINKLVMFKLLRYGYPAGLEFLLNFAAFNFMIMLFHSDGPLTATAITITFNWDLVSFVPLMGLQIAVTSLVGRYMGAERVDYAHKATMSALKLGWMYSFIIFVLFITMSGTLVEIFSPSGDTELFLAAKPIAARMIKLASIYVMTESVILSFSGALRGAGDTLWTMIISVSIHWVLIVVTYLMLKVLHCTAMQSWFAVICVFSLFGVSFFLRYRSGKWKQIEVIQHKH